MNHQAPDEDQVRALIERRADAFKKKDAAGFYADYAENTVTFDLAPPLQYEGTNPKLQEEWFATWRTGIGHEIRDLTVAVDGNTGFAHSLVRMFGTRSDGANADVWFRETLCFQKIDGKWYIVHEHLSVPMHMDGSNRAAVDLAP